MSYDGSLTFDTSIDTSGFNTGVSKISSIASTGLKATLGIITAAAAGIVAFGKSAVEAGTEFDSAMSQLAATMGTTVDEIDDLRETAIAMGESTAYSATEAAEGLNILAQAGYDATAQMDMIGSVLNLAAAGATSMDNAASYLTTTLKGYCIEGENVGETSEYYANLIAKGATLVNTSVDELGTAMADSAASANFYGQEVETTTTALLALADGGKTGAEAATALNRLMTDLYAPTSAAAEALEDLGVSAYDLETGEARDLLDVIADLQAATAGMVDEEKNAIMNTVLTTQGMKAYSAITTKTADEVDALTASLIDCTDAAADMADTQMDNLEGDITKFESALGTLQVRITDDVSPALRDFVQMGTEQMGILSAAVGENGLQGGIEAVGDVLANLLAYVGELAPSIIETGSNLIHNFCEGLQDTALTSGTATSVVGDLISAFLSCAADIWSTATVLFTSFVQGIADSVPDIISSASDMVTTLVDTIIEYAPQLVTAATDIISELITGLGEGLPSLVTQGALLLSTIADAIIDNLPTIVSAATEGISSFVSGITESLPTLSTAAVDIMTSLGTYLQENLPTILESGLTALTELTASLRENAGVLVDGALAMIESIATGLIDSLPTLIETVPEIVSNIANIINDNAPKLLETAFNLISELGLGLINAIPTLVANIPQIIQAIVDVFTAFNWLNIGKSIMTALKNGIQAMTAGLKQAGTDILNSVYSAIKSLPSKLLSLGKSAGSSMSSGLKGMLSAIKSAASSILNGVVSAISNLPSKLLTIGTNAITKMKSVFKVSEWKNIGKNIINGIISGITSMISSLYSSIKNALSGLVNKAKSALGISSPSKVFAEEIGEWIPPGIGEGVEDAMPDLLSDAQGQMDELTDKMKATVALETGKIQVEHGATSTYQANKDTGAAFSTGDTTVEISGTIQSNVTLDGKKVAEGITPFVDRELSKRATKRERGNIIYL